MRGSRDGENVVETHRQVGDDDLRHRGEQRFRRGAPGGVRRAAQLAIHLPAHPEQQKPAREQQPDDRQELQGDRAERHADDRRTGDAEQDRAPLLLLGQPRYRQSHDEGVVAGQRHVDADHLGESGQSGEDR